MGVEEKLELKKYDDKVLKKIQKYQADMLKDFVDVCKKYNIEYFAIAGTGIGALRHSGFIPWDDDIDIAMPRKDFIKFIDVYEKEIGDKYYFNYCETDVNFPLMTAHLIYKGSKFVNHNLEESGCNNGIYLDIFPYDNVSRKKLKKFIQFCGCFVFSKLLILRGIKKPVFNYSGFSGKILEKSFACVHYVLRFLRISKKFLYKANYKFATMANNEENVNYISFLSGTFPKFYEIDFNKLYPLKKIEFEGIKINFPNNIEEILTTMYGDYMKMPDPEKRYNHCPKALKFPGEDEIRYE